MLLVFPTSCLHYNDVTSVVLQGPMRLPNLDSITHAVAHVLWDGIKGFSTAFLYHIIVNHLGHWKTKVFLCPSIH